MSEPRPDVRTLGVLFLQTSKKQKKVSNNFQINVFLFVVFDNNSNDSIKNLKHFLLLNTPKAWFRHVVCQCNHRSFFFDFLFSSHISCIYKEMNEEFNLFRLVSNPCKS